MRCRISLPGVRCPVLISTLAVVPAASTSDVGSMYPSVLIGRADSSPERVRVTQCQRSAGTAILSSTPADAKTVAPTGTASLPSPPASVTTTAPIDSARLASLLAGILQVLPTVTLFLAGLLPTSTPMGVRAASGAKTSGVGSVYPSVLIGRADSSPEQLRVTRCQRSAGITLLSSPPAISTTVAHIGTEYAVSDGNRITTVLVSIHSASGARDATVALIGIKCAVSDGNRIVAASVSNHSAFGTRDAT
eukprot:gene5655-biopygen9338